MTYTHLKTYLDTNLIQDHSSDKITLISNAQSKYQLSELNSEDKFTQTFTNFYHSLNATLTQDSNYHLLPSYTNQFWEDLFPLQNQTFFGLKTNQERIEKDIYDKLWEIFDDWQADLRQEQADEQRDEQQKKYDKLNKLISDEGLLGQFMMEAIINMNYELIKRGKYDLKLEEWLQEYQTLNEDDQEALKEAQTKVKEVLKWIRKHEQQKTEQSWLPNWPWKKIAWYGGGGLLILLVISWIWKKFKSE